MSRGEGLSAARTAPGGKDQFGRCGQSVAQGGCTGGAGRGGCAYFHPVILMPAAFPDEQRHDCLHLSGTAMTAGLSYAGGKYLDDGFPEIAKTWLVAVNLNSLSQRFPRKWTLRRS